MAETLRLVSDRRPRATRTVLSARGGPLEASPRLQRFLVIFEDGRMLAAPTALDDPELLTIRQRATSLGIRLDRPQEATLDEISAANANVANVTEYATQARQTLLSILNRAARRHASDIMINRDSASARIRLRISGLMQDHRTLDPERATAVSNAAMNACDSGDSLGSATRAVRASITNRKILPPGVLGVRLQYAPTARGFVLIMRLSYESAAIHCSSLEEAGFDALHSEAVRAALQSSAGVFVVAGPTEHGKSTTLNLAIEEFARSYAQHPNVIAVEDPPETLHIPYVQTFAINSSVEREEDAFANALMAALRLAPDGIKIGELRDPVSARTAFRAAGSGALVFTTLHASFATDVPFRLMDLGLERYRAFEPLNIAWIAQRLVPLVCPHCAIPAARTDTSIHRALKADAAGCNLDLGQACFSGGGCAECDGTGHAGRRLVCEVIRPAVELLETGLAADTTRQSFRRAWLRSGGVPMTVGAFALVRRGEVSLDAFIRNVTSFEALKSDLRHAAGRN